MDNIHRAIIKKFDIRRRGSYPVVCRRGDRLVLVQLLGELGLNKGVEVGTHKGEFAEALCLANPNLTLTCVDPWRAYESFTQELQDQLYIVATERLSKYTVTIMKLPSCDALGEFEDKSLDFVYIDGDHSFDMCCFDLIFWSTKVRSGGIIAAHDYYTPFWPGVTGAVDAYLHAHNIRPIYVTRERKMTAFWVNP